MNQVVRSSDIDSLVNHTETALQRGQHLLNWWSAHAGKVRTFRLPIRTANSADIRAFFDTIGDGANQTSVMGCLQTARLPIAKDLVPRESSFDSFLKAQFARQARWVNPSGGNAGFGYEALVAKTKSSPRLIRFEDENRDNALDLTLVESVYDWVLMRVNIYDFLQAMPMSTFLRPFAKFFRTAAYIVSHEMFAYDDGWRPNGTIQDCQFGYSFLPCACLPNIFGFGPGNFHAAVKLFRFFLLEESELEVQLTFIVAPRSNKVFDVLPFDPVYTIINAMDALTFGKFSIKRIAHDVFDKNFLRVHGVVHQNLLNGMEHFWQRQAYDAKKKGS